MDSYHTLSTIGVFIAVIKDQESRLVEANSVMVRKYIKMEDTLYSILCEMHAFVSSQGEVMYVDTGVVPTDVKEKESDYERFERDYLIIKDIPKILIRQVNLHTEIRVKLREQDV